MSEVADPRLQVAVEVRRRRPPPSGGQRLADRPRRYLVFCHVGPPKGGWGDYRASYTSLQLASIEASSAVRGQLNAVSQVVDLEALRGPEVVLTKRGPNG